MGRLNHYQKNYPPLRISSGAATGYHYYHISFAVLTNGQHGFSTTKALGKPTPVINLSPSCQALERFSWSMCALSAIKQKPITVSSHLCRAYKTIEDDDLKFPLIYGEGKKVRNAVLLT